MIVCQMRASTLVASTHSNMLRMHRTATPVHSRGKGRRLVQCYPAWSRSTVNRGDIPPPLSMISCQSSPPRLPPQPRNPPVPSSPTIAQPPLVVHAITQATDADFGTFSRPPWYVDGNPAPYIRTSVLCANSPNTHPPIPPSQRPSMHECYAWQPSAAHSPAVMCDRLKLWSPIINEQHTVLLQAIVKHTIHHTIPKPWASVHHLQAIGHLHMY